MVTDLASRPHVFYFQSGSAPLVSNCNFWSAQDYLLIWNHIWWITRLTSSTLFCIFLMQSMPRKYLKTIHKCSKIFHLIEGNTPQNINFWPEKFRFHFEVLKSGDTVRLPSIDFPLRSCRDRAIPSIPATKHKSLTQTCIK